jgi:ferredoxin--NADP+ reductase
VRFLVSPVELVGDEDGRVTRMRLVRNVLAPDGKGGISAKPTGEFEDLDVGLVFRSVGYRGVSLPGVPFHDKWGVIPNEKGRVIDPATGQAVAGLYATGWIKRGPSGVIGTNKPDAVETVTSMMEDAAAGVVDSPHCEAAAAEATIRARQTDVVSYADWRRLDALELATGKASGRPRVKFTSIEAMLAALDRTAPTR